MDEGSGVSPTASNTSSVSREKPPKGWQRVPAAAVGQLALTAGWLRLHLHGAWTESIKGFFSLVGDEM